jgi:hypothetical protein
LADGLKAASNLSQNSTFDAGLHMPRDFCVYSHVGSTVVSLCNTAEDRAVADIEVESGINQLIADCGTDGPFSGVHYASGLKFSAYGIYGGRSMQEESFPPVARAIEDFHRVAEARQEHDPCDIMGFTGDTWYNCSKPVGHRLIPETGVCGPPTAENKCQVYCEVRRTGFLGMETNAPKQFANQVPPGISLALTEGEEESISLGFSTGIEGVIEDIFGAGVSFEC